MIDVPADDMPNVRAAPSATARIVGALNPDAQAVAAVRSGRLMRVNVG